MLKRNIRAIVVDIDALYYAVSTGGYFINQITDVHLALTTTGTWIMLSLATTNDAVLVIVTLVVSATIALVTTVPILFVSIWSIFPRHYFLLTVICFYNTSFNVVIFNPAGGVYTLFQSGSTNP
jgi:hypothetical protein